MKKLLFVISTLYLGLYLFVILPAHTSGVNSFIYLHNASERETAIIKDVCEKKDHSFRLALGSMLGIYILFAGSMILGREKKPNHTIKSDEMTAGGSR